MKTGPKPKPTHLKILEGNPGKRPLNKNEPKPNPIAPKCPSWLSSIAKKEWSRLAPELEKLGILTSIDGTAFAVLCQQIANYRLATEKINKEGILIGGVKKQKHPAIQIQRDSAAAIKTFASEFGLTPVSRTRLSIPGDDKDDDDIFDT